MGTRLSAAWIGVAISVILGPATARADVAPPAGVSAFSIDFNTVPVARSWSESKLTFDGRAEAVLWSTALGSIPASFTGGNFVDAILSRLELGVDLEAANRAILNPATKIYGHCGTDAAPLGPVLCRRVGDYDFALRGWMVVLYRFWNRPDRLWPESRDKILHVLDPERGNHVHNWRFFCGIPVHETENHILMTETSKYLTNQLLNRERLENGKRPLKRYDNARNGMTTWMLKHLQQFLLADFQEYNSRPYQPYAVMAIQNLFEYAYDERVRLMSQDVLDYLGAKYALTSANLRRLPPFRRNDQYWGNWGLYVPDGEAARILGLTGAADMLAGYTSPMVWNFQTTIAMPAVLGRYRLPDVVGEWLFDPASTESFERFSYDGLELYARRPEYVVSAGGIYSKIQKLIPFKMPNDGYVNPTTLIPSRGVEMDASQLVRIEGHTDFTKRVNTCVARDFACGVNPALPADLPASCARSVPAEGGGRWTFLNLNGPGCPLDYGFYAVELSLPCDSGACRAAGSSYGFFEAAPASSMAFDDFVSRVLTFNGGVRFTSLGRNRYVTSAAHEIEFKFLESDSRTWPIVALDGVKQERATSRWPFVQGELMRADGRGLVVIQDRSGTQALVLDVRDPLHPRRALAPENER